MSFLGTLRKNLYALRGNKKYARFEELAKMQYLSPEELRNKQFIELSKLIEHAYSTTAYYNNLFKTLDITPNDIKSFEDYTKLPVLTKSIMQENLEDLCSSTTPKNMRILNSSGGTTGNPASFYQDNRVFSEMDAHFLLILSFAGWKPEDMIFQLWGNTKDFHKQKNLQFIKPWLAGFHMCNTFRYGPKDMEIWVQAIKRYKKVFLYGYACALTDFARYCQENNHNLPNIGGVISTAEQLFPHYREIMEKAFQCKVYDQYGAREVPGVASECKHGQMHILPSASHTEFLPLEKKGMHEENASSGENREAKRLILTNLVNYTMPLLRYEIGDFATPIISDIPCSCGMTTHRMQMNVGRIGGTLLLPSGEKLYSSLFVRQICAIPGIENFQFRQTSLQSVDLYIVKNKNFSENSQKLFQEFKEKFPKEICLGASLSIHYVDDIPRTQGGKHRQVVCEVTQ